MTCTVPRTTVHELCFSSLTCRQHSTRWTSDAAPPSSIYIWHIRTDSQLDKFILGPSHTVSSRRSTAVDEHRMPIRSPTRLCTWTTTIQSVHVTGGSSYQRIRREPYAIRGRHTTVCGTERRESDSDFNWLFSRSSPLVGSQWSVTQPRQNGSHRDWHFSKT